MSPGPSVDLGSFRALKVLQLVALHPIDRQLKRVSPLRSQEMFRTYSKIPRSLRPNPRPVMLYSQALNGGHQAAPSSSSSTSPSAAKIHPETTTTATTTARTPKEINTKQNHNPPRRQHQHHQPQPPNNPNHTPNTPNTPSTTTGTQQQQQQQQPQTQKVYILTLTTTPSLTNPLTALRKTHFPRKKDRGNLPAHLTLFHALPGGSEMDQHIVPALEELCRQGAQKGVDGSAAAGPLRLATGPIFRMRRGIGIKVAGDDAPRAETLHATLQRRWWAFLSPQDRQKPWRPHWTVQNKAADEAAVDAALEDVLTGFRGAEGLATGCALWRYDKSGRWTFERGFDFGGDKVGGHRQKKQPKGHAQDTAITAGPQSP